MNMYEATKRILPDPVFNIVHYLQVHRDIPNLIRPKTFNQKVLHRKLFDRRPILTTFCDKYAIRDYVIERVGAHLLPELYYVTTEPKTIPFDALPDKFVIKPSHGSGWVELITDKSKIDREALIQTCNDWLSRSYYRVRREWAYKKVKPRMLIQEYIDDGNGLSPNDYKLFVYNGTTAFIQVDLNKFGDHQQDFYNTEWEKLPVIMIGWQDKSYRKINGSFPRPRHFDEMLEAARLLGSGIDFVRIDFYDTDHKLYFGEITPTPTNGMRRFHPKEYDRVFGELWQIR